jgi:hypothetical protein
MANRNTLTFFGCCFSICPHCQFSQQPTCNKRQIFLSTITQKRVCSKSSFFVSGGRLSREKNGGKCLQWLYLRILQVSWPEIRFSSRVHGTWLSSCDLATRGDDQQEYRVRSDRQVQTLSKILVGIPALFFHTSKKEGRKE